MHDSVDAGMSRDETTQLYTLSGRPRSSRMVTKNARTRKQIMQAAVKVISRHGYAGCTIARIAEKAKIAHGTFYLYFKSQQQLFDQLLPAVHEEMRIEVARAVEGARTIFEVEELGLRANFDYIKHNPHEYRVWAEAEVYAPKAYLAYMDIVNGGYIRQFRRLLCGDRPADDALMDKLLTISNMLVGARAELLRRYGVEKRKFVGVHEETIAVYLRFAIAGMKAVLEDELAGSTTTSDAARPD